MGGWGQRVRARPKPQRRRHPTRDLSRRLPLVKWLLAIRTTSCSSSSTSGALRRRLSVFAILFTGRFPRGAFEYLVGVGTIEIEPE